MRYVQSCRGRARTRSARGRRWRVGGGGRPAGRARPRARPARRRRHRRSGCRSRRSPVSMRTVRPVSGSIRVSSPTSTRVSSRGSVISIARTVCRPAIALISRRQSCGAAEVRDDDDESGAGARGSDHAERSLHRGRTAALVRRFGVERAEQAGEPDPAAGGRRDRFALARAEGDDAEAVGPSSDEATHHERRTLGHVGLAPVGGAELHRGGLVEEHPRGHLPVRHVLADLRGEASGGGVPVDAADVVARLVGTEPVELEAFAETAAAVVAGHPATDASGQRDLEPSDEVVRDRARGRDGRGFEPVRPRRPGPRSAARRSRRRPCHARHAEISPAMSRDGARTRVSTRATIESGVIPSARAA